MKTSQRGLDLIVDVEGLRLKKYLCSAGKPTIGVGHLILPGEDFSGGITEDEAMDLLAKDISWAENAVNEWVEVELSQNEFDALVSFVFNFGPEAFRKSTLLRILNEGDYAGVPNQLRRWVRAGGRRVTGLVNRREREISLWEGK